MQIKPIKACQGKGPCARLVREWPCHPFSSTGLGGRCEFVLSQPNAADTACRCWHQITSRGRTKLGDRLGVGDEGNQG